MPRLSSTLFFDIGSRLALDLGRGVKHVWCWVRVELRDGDDVRVPDVELQFPGVAVCHGDVGRDSTNNGSTSGPILEQEAARQYTSL